MARLEELIAVGAVLALGAYYVFAPEDAMATGADEVAASDPPTDQMVNTLTDDAPSVFGDLLSIFQPEAPPMSGSWSVSLPSNVRVKDSSVNLDLAPEMTPVIPIVAEVWQERGGPIVTITSGRDGQHMSDRHPKGLALDFRTRDVALGSTGDEVLHRARLILAQLGAGYDVLIEGDHLHVEFDGNVNRSVGFLQPNGQVARV